MSNVTFENGILTVNSTITFATVASVLKDGNKLLQHATGDVTVDFSAVKAIDSSALALMLEWKRMLAGKKANLQFTQVPSDLSDMASVCRVSEILKI